MDILKRNKSQLPLWLSAILDYWYSLLVWHTIVSMANLYKQQRDSQGKSENKKLLSKWLNKTKRHPYEQKYYIAIKRC